MGFWDFVYNDSYKIEARRGSASRRGRAALKVFALRGCARQVGIGAMTARLGEAAWMAWRRVSSSTTRCWQASGAARMRCIYIFKALSLFILFCASLVIFS